MSRVFLATDITDPTEEHKMFYLELTSLIRQGGHEPIDLYSQETDPALGNGKSSRRALYRRIENLIYTCDLFITTEVSSIDSGVMLGVANRFCKPAIILKPKRKRLDIFPPNNEQYFEIINYKTLEDAKTRLEESLKKVFQH